MQDGGKPDVGFKSDIDGDLTLLAYDEQQRPGRWEVALVDVDGNRQLALGGRGEGGIFYPTSEKRPPVWWWLVEGMRSCHVEIQRPHRTDVVRLPVRRLAGKCQRCLGVDVPDDPTPADAASVISTSFRGDADVGSALGDGWYAGWPSSPPEVSDDVRTYLRGTPPDLMLVLTEDTATVAAPVGVWDGVWPMYYVPGQPQTAASLLDRRGALAALSAALPSIAAGRRASFSRCRYCRRTTPPEYAHADDPRVCMACAEKHLGVVH